MTHAVPTPQAFVPSRFRSALEAAQSISALIKEIEEREAKLQLMIASTDHLFSNRLDISDDYVIGRGKGGKPVLGRKER